MNGMSGARQFSGEKVLLAFFVVLNIVQYILVSELGLYISDGRGFVGASSIAQFFVLCAIIFCYCFFYWYYKLVVKNINAPDRKPSNIQLVLLFGMLLTFLGFILFDYGRAESSSSLSFGFVFRLVPTDFLFGYYIATCDFKRLFPRIIVVLFVLLKISMGWTGVLAATFFTLFVRWANADLRGFGFYVRSVFVLCVLFLIAPFLYAVKFFIRWDDYDFVYVDVLSQLTGRMGVYSNSLYISEYIDAFVQLCRQHVGGFSFLYDAVISVTPRALIGINTENMETVFVSLVAGDFNKGVTFYLGYLAKLYTYFHVDPIEGVLFIFTSLIFLCVISFLAFARFGRAATPAIFVIFLQTILSGSMEELGYTVYATAFIYIACMPYGRRNASYPNL